MFLCIYINIWWIIAFSFRTPTIVAINGPIFKYIDTNIFASRMVPCWRFLNYWFLLFPLDRNCIPFILFMIFKLIHNWFYLLEYFLLVNQFMHLVFFKIMFRLWIVSFVHIVMCKLCRHFRRRLIKSAIITCFIILQFIMPSWTDLILTLISDKFV